MSKDKSLLYSKYIIDGVPQDLTPAQMMGDPGCAEAPVTIVDETLDPSPAGFAFDLEKIGEYLEAVRSVSKLSVFPHAFSEEYTRGMISKSLIDALWKKEHFLLEDLSVKAKWRWRDEGAGSLASFYKSVAACCEYLDALNLSTSEFSFDDGKCEFSVSTSKESEHSCVESKFVKDPDSWIIYVPFDTSSFRLGGSSLYRALGISGGVAPQSDDPDYFMDCFEVVRELVEDDIVLSGATVLHGGLITALKGMSSSKTGADIDVSDLMKAYDTEDLVRTLFSELPGAIIQIRDADFDYIDAEFILQDIMYFPLGHPTENSSTINVGNAMKSSIGNILDSLIR